MSGNQNNDIIDEAKKLIINVNKMIKLHTEVMDILMDYYSSHNYERIREFKEKASEKVNEALAMTEQALELARDKGKGKGKDDKGKGKMKAETSGNIGNIGTSGTKGTSGGSSRRGRRSRVKKSTVQYEIDDILTGGYWKEMKKKK